MEINVAKSAGFCFGVRRAIKTAYATARLSKPTHMLGDIVHNEDVVGDIERAGIIKISRLGKGRGKILLVRAHGAPKSLFSRAQRAGYTVVDATCPMVKEIHTLAIQAEQDKYPVIIIGEKKHDEVRGIVGQLRRKPLIIEGMESVPLPRIKKLHKAAVLVQSTQNLEKTLQIIELLQQHIPDLKFFNTICRPTRSKQKEIQRMPLQNDVMIIIGSKSSANTHRLYELSKALNPRSYLIQSAADIKPAWFSRARSVGITSGASTPDATTLAVIERLKKISSAADG